MGGQPRVMHGAYDGFADVSTAGPVTLFFPEGVVLEMTAQEAAAFYQAIGRVSVINICAPRAMPTAPRGHVPAGLRLDPHRARTVRILTIAV